MSSNARLIGNYAFSMYAFLDSNNYPMGTDSTPDVKASGQTAGAYLYDKSISLAGFGKTYEVIQGKGGGKVWVKKVVGVNDIANMALSLSGEDPTLQSYWNGSVVDTTTNSSNVGFNPNHEGVAPPRFMSAHYSEYHKADGSSVWRSHFVLNHQVIQPAGASLSDSGGTNPNPLSFEIVPTSSNRLPWGQLFSANANIVADNDKDYEYMIEAPYPYGICTYVDDGSTTSSAFTLPYVPASTTVADYYVYNNGVDDSSNVSGVTSGGVVSLTAANTEFDVMVVLYPLALPLALTS